MRHKAKIVLALLVLNFISGPACASNEAYLQKVVSAIEKAENSAKYPFGIKSVKVNSYQEAKQTCLNVVRYRYWLWSTRSDVAPSPKSQGLDFISYLASSYCPIGAPDDKKTNVNRFWISNVNHFLTGVA